MSNTNTTPTTPAVLPPDTPSYSYQVGVSQLLQVLIDWQKDLRYVALEPDQALALAGHLKRVANLAIVQRKKTKQAAALADKLKAQIKQRSESLIVAANVKLPEYANGEPYYCAKCGFGKAEFMACEEESCKLESVEAAIARRDWYVAEKQGGATTDND